MNSGLGGRGWVHFAETVIVVNGALTFVLVKALVCVFDSCLHCFNIRRLLLIY